VAIADGASLTKQFCQSHGLFAGRNAFDQDLFAGFNRADSM
jgi:hypothetical protein